MGQPSAAMTASEYLAWEREQVERHEYHRGEVYSMAGGSPRHNAISAAEYFLVSQALPRIECYRRRERGWAYEVVEARGTVTVRDDLELEIDAIYDGVLALPD